MATPASEPVNPYAAPQIEGGYFPAQQTGFDGLWRDGDILVMHKQAPLPPICVKSGQPATDWLQRDLQWHPPWVTWLILFAVPAYVVLALILTRKATVIIGLSREWRNRRLIRMLITAGIVSVGLAVAVGGFSLATQREEFRIAFLFVPIGLIGGLIAGTAYGQHACRLVWPKRINGQFIWLRGVHSDFLKLLPEWPGGTI